MQRESLIEPLSHLEQGDIAKSRSIENASIKPRFRIMAEPHSEGNPHRYPEIKPRTVNLILKIPSTNIERWLKEEFASIGLKPYISHKNKVIRLELNFKGKPLTFEVFVIRHKRNGDHLVIQSELPDLDKTIQAESYTKSRRLRESQTLFEFEE